MTANLVGGGAVTGPVFDDYRLWPCGGRCAAQVGEVETPTPHGVAVSGGGFSRTVVVVCEVCGDAQELDGEQDGWLADAPQA